MDLVEKGISPLLRNVQQNATGDIRRADLAIMEKVTEAKLDILQNNRGESKSDLIRPEIAESWIRSRNYGLNLYDYNYGPMLDKHAFEDLRNQKTLLLEAAAPLIRQMMLMCSNSLIQLSDEKGVILFVEPDKDGIFFGNINKEYLLNPGVVWSEETVGTLSHTLSLVYGVPMQMYGSEHFSETYQKNIASSAPIFDVNNNIAGSVCLVNRNSVYENTNSLALVVSVAKAIERELHLISERLLSSALLESADKSIITVNKSGLITNANVNARRIFGAKLPDLTGIRIEDIIGNQPLVRSVLETRKPIHDAEINIEKLNQRFHLSSAKPLDDSYGNNYGYVLVLEKLVTERKRPFPASSLETRFSFSSILGKSTQFVKSVELAKKFARLDGSILIQGESGTGKEMFAQAIHNEGRPYGPFIAINCAAIPKNLIESELFGYEGGAFTGAESQGRKGKIELASGGTLFLDEIGDMPLELQPTILRVLEDKQLMRIGGSRYVPVDFRLITATNHDIQDLMEKKQFREDLYYRLETFQIYIPPLRERGQDIIELAQYFIHAIAEKQGIPAPALSEAVIYRLLQFDWPGNIRQLKNAVLYAVNSTSDGVIKPEDLPPAIRGTSTGSARGRVKESPAVVYDQEAANEHRSIKEMEKMMVIQALVQTRNNFAEAARLLGISKSSLYRKIKDYHLSDEVRGG
ncbi:MAG: sigma 54-interacting transcriptional regulator [Firmicutes bacterium]|nr:sigma 54-interacting transcriptional regulator [Bacillota bacterium]